MEREVDPHRGALAYLTVDPDMALRLFGEAIDHRKTQPFSLPDRLRCEEWIEHLNQDIGRHAGSRVRDTDRHVLSWPHILLRSSMKAVQLRHSGFNDEL